MRFIFVSSLIVFLSSSGFSARADYSAHPKAIALIKKMHEKYGMPIEKTKSVLAQAKKKNSVLEAISRPAEKTKAWFEYRKIFLGQKRIDQGVVFWRQNKRQLERAALEYGVMPEVIVSIIGVETRYGRHMGSYRVLDALATLGFDYPKRAKFFRSELEHFLLLTKEQQKDPVEILGSYAGAMGYGQFIPSSYRNFAIDFDGDKKVNIWSNSADAIGSVANYLHAHGWAEKGSIAVPAKITIEHDKTYLNNKTPPRLTLAEAEKYGYVASVEGSYDRSLKVLPLVFKNEKGQEFWLGFNNFYVVTRYNHSHLYAMAVLQLSQKIKHAYALLK